MLEHGGRLREAAAHYQISLENWLDLSTGINPETWPVPTLSMDCWHRLPEADDTLLMRGGSCIVGPLGQVLAGPVYGEDALLTAEIDMDDIPRAQMDFDPVGHYARPDVFQLAVNTAPQRAVHLAPGAAHGA